MTIAPRLWVAALDPYVPGRPAASDDGSLASNESALGASPAVRAAIQEAAARIHRYPARLPRARLGAGGGTVVAR
jgi:histidinol-phosphate aminotransferase